MSSAEEDYEGDSAQNAKKRRIQRACDMCRRKKSDGAQMPGNRCSNCVSYRLECTYVEAAKKRGPPKGYVESLETRLEKMEKLLNKLCPNADFTKELGGSFDRDAWLTERNGEPSGAGPGVGSVAGKSAYGIPPQTPSSVIGSPCAHPSSAQVDSEDLDPSDDEVIAQRNIVAKLEKMSVHPSTMRYHGKSSSLLFIQTAMDLKHEYVAIHLPPTVDPDAHNVLLRRHQQHWSLHPWLTSTVHDEIPPHKDFPRPELLAKLVDLYFQYMNCYMPLLHRPTFEQGIKDGLHLHDEGFGSTVLLVCANGARFTDDPRVLLEGYDTTQTSGWKWFQQVQMVRKSLLAPPRLYDLQIYALTASFLQGTSAPQACWTIIGIGIRMAQDVGAHRKKVYSPKPTMEEELWRRAFWTLVAMDRHASFALGRPCAIQDEDFDLDLPTECDDEYWSHPDPEQAFKQPPGKPSTITFFNCYIRLHQILAFALRTIYSINKSKALLGFVGQQWEQHIVAELDSALNKWIDSVPDHLRWDPNRENLLFLNQSANLYAHYYQLQIAVHRPFIPSPRKPSPLSFPSLAICTNAARSCIHVLDLQYNRAGGPTYFNQMSLFTAGIVLLLNIWGGKRSGLSTDPAKEMADVHKCMKMLKLLEAHWHTAGRLWDILYELASVGDLPLPQASPAPNHKRERDSDSPMSSAAPTPASDSCVPSPSERAMAGSRRVSKDAPSLASATFAQPLRSQSQTHSKSQSTASTPSATSDTEKAPASAAAAAAAAAAGKTVGGGNGAFFALPLHTEELGRLPLHPGFSTVYPPEWPPPASMGTQQPMAPMPAPSSSSANPFDPRVLSMFNVPGPSGFNEMFAAHSPSAADAAGYPSTFAPELSTMAAPGQEAVGAAGAGAGVGVGMPGLTAQELAFADNTLDMWSTAPTGFEWADWGTYINNVSGLSHPAGPTHAPAPGT
ncbi:fungal-specific transcription factor domain-containing protein [Trametes gibbosa]|nr:fungal-specific transcription factor domain-containing protein [Trametes gibbosa]UVI59116.1 Zn(2)-Cys(6)12 [Trametes gibbosa]